MCQPPISTLFPYTTLFRSFAISGAEVFVGTAEVGVNAAAVSVNCDMTVLAADVRTTATSGVGSTDAGGDPQAAIRRAHKSKVKLSFRFIEPPSRSAIYGLCTSNTTVTVSPKKTP